MNLLTHINTLKNNTSTTHGIGVDYDAALIKSAGIQSDLLENINVQWLIYDFNDDQNDLVDQLITTHQVTHIFIYLVPRQLALPTVRNILTRLCESGVIMCCHKFFPQYLTPARSDILMDLAVYDIASCNNTFDCL